MHTTSDTVTRDLFRVYACADVDIHICITQGLGNYFVCMHVQMLTYTYAEYH